MNAKQAREQALSITNTSNQREYETIKKAISAKVDDGKLECTVYRTISEAVTIILKGEGFEIGESIYDPRGETSTTIKW